MVTAEGASAGGVAQVLSAISQLLWPVVALVLAYWLLPEMKQIFHRVSESKNLKVKWGDKELSIQEAADNIQKVVGSLMDAEAPRAPTVASAPAITPVPPPAAAAPGNPRSEPVPPESQLAAARMAAFSLRRVLWVDDKPNKIALETARLKDWGVRIDEARSTEEAVELFEPHKYSLVITDMHRSEQGAKNAVAGIDLLKELKKEDPTVVVIAYCAAFSASKYGAAFLKLGGTFVTSSAVELFEQLNQYLARD